RTIEGDLDSLWKVAFSPDGKYLVSGHISKVVRVWDWQKGNLVFDIDHKVSDVRALAFSPDSKLLLLGGFGKTVLLLEMQTKAKTFLNSALPWIHSLAVSPDGSLFVAGNESTDLVEIWDLKEKKVVRTFRVSLAQVHALAFSPDGIRLFVACNEVP